MSPINRLQPVFVEAIPSVLRAGHLYISKRYRTAVHLCCCGCGLEVVTPLNPAKWRLTERGDTVSLYPSIGNWSFPCQSHYVITRNRVIESGSWSTERIEAERSRDRAAKLDYYNSKCEEVSKSSSSEPAHAAPVSFAKLPLEQDDSWWGRLRRRFWVGGR